MAAIKSSLQDSFIHMILLYIFQKCSEKTQPHNKFRSFFLSDYYLKRIPYSNYDDNYLNNLPTMLNIV